MSEISTVSAKHKSKANSKLKKSPSEYRLLFSTPLR